MDYRYRCRCGGSLVPCKIAIEDKGIYLGTVCYKQWCPKCGNPYMDIDGNVAYYQIKGNGYFTNDPIDFWAPESVQFQHKHKFIHAVLKLANQNRFKGTQTYTMKDIRNAFREEQGSKDYATYGEKI